MNSLLREVQDFVYFCRVFGRYGRKRIDEWSVRFEKHKDALVSILLAKRGLYQRPFLHTSLFMLVVVGIVIAPMVKTSYEAQASQLDDYTPPSAVLTSLDEQETQTQISDKPRDQVITYTVESGDTLSEIAEKFNVSVDSVKWANPDLKGEKVTVGDELSIPPVTGLVIKVQKGETVYSIAKKYQVDAQNIVNFPFNDFTDLDTFALAAGQTLIVPDGVMPESKPIYSPRTIAQVGVTAGDGQFIWPTQGRITQNPVTYHMALDIANSSLPPVAAADAGTVILVKQQRYDYGWHIIVDHGNGYQTLYAHLSDIYVSEGQGVSRGSVIGKVGSTGRSTGPHLHFEIRKGGVLLNPLSFLK
ncbi:LysM peptidoglycan-binding domain-containing protein [Candidatus Microgenomates bacterium]|nr:MAG: LysM peptidoglycan-binding domain-containing protein [Candidatus Microgenomates bacterium]